MRGRGFLAGVELVADKETKRPFPSKAACSARAARLGLEEGVVVYPCSGGVDGEDGDCLLLMPPFVTTERDLVEMIGRLATALERLAAEW